MEGGEAPSYYDKFMRLVMIACMRMGSVLAAMARMPIKRPGGRKRAGEFAGWPDGLRLGRRRAQHTGIAEPLNSAPENEHGRRGRDGGDDTAKEEDGEGKEEDPFLREKGICAAEQGLEGHAGEEVGATV